MSASLNRAFLTLLILGLAPLLSATAARAQGTVPPESPAEVVHDLLHGQRIADPYRWLEDLASERVEKWVDAQNGHTRRCLDAFPGREAIARRVAQLQAIGEVSDPAICGKRIFYAERSGDANQPRVFMCDRSDMSDAHEPRVVLDPNLLSPGRGTVAVDWWYPAPDGDLVAYGVSENGTEESVLAIRDVERGVDLPERIGGTAWSSLAWHPDGRSFCYTRFLPGLDASEPASERRRGVYRHTLGEDPAGDPLLYEATHPAHWPTVKISPDGRTLLIIVYHGWDRSELFKVALEGDTRIVPLVTGVEAMSWGDFLDDARLLLATNLDAPRVRIVEVDLAHPGPADWREFLPETADATVKGFVLARGQVVVEIEKNATSSLVALDLEDRARRELPLPAPAGTVSGLWADRRESAVVFAFESFFHPSAIHFHDLETGTSQAVRAIECDVDLSRFGVTRASARSKDGTSVPLWILGDAEMNKNVERPALLTGYGGFGISLTPTFQRSRLVWLEKGGIVAIANLRGGGEFGQDWHAAGRLGSKQNVFDDFLAAARWLVDEGITRPESLAIEGGSNGGLLVAAALTQRPDLFGAAIASVPLTDMIRYPRLGLGYLWVSEYGDPEAPDAFRWLANYSPYHRATDGTAYPAVLLTTGDHDTRVHPSHAYKMTARLQAATSSGRPVLLRIERDSGHGAGKPQSKTAAELVDRWTFLHAQLGIAYE